MAFFRDGHDQPELANEPPPGQQEADSSLHSHNSHDGVVGVHMREVEALLGSPLNVAVTLAGHTDSRSCRTPTLGRRPHVGRHARLSCIHVLT